MDFFPCEINGACLHEVSKMINLEEVTSFPCFAMDPLEAKVTTAHRQCLARKLRAASGPEFSSPLNLFCSKRDVSTLHFFKWQS